MLAFTHWLWRLKLAPPASTSTSKSLVSNQTDQNVLIIFLDRPGPPGTPVISELNNECCRVDWTPPQDQGGAQILGYYLERKKVSHEIWIFVWNFEKLSQGHVRSMGPTQHKVDRVPQLFGASHGRGKSLPNPRRCRQWLWCRWTIRLVWSIHAACSHIRSHTVAYWKIDW